MNNVVNDVSGSQTSSLSKYSFTRAFQVTYSNFHGGITAPSGTGNTSQDPKFQNAGSGNFRLNSSSPLINRGRSVNGVKMDYDGNPRPSGSSVDIGAFEYKDN